MTEINKTLIFSGFLSFGTMYLSAILKKAGHQCDVTSVDYNEAEQVFMEFSPDIVAYSAFTGLHVPMVEINRKLKKKFKFFSMFGGPHPTFSPELIEEEGIDAICRAEGFEAVPNLVNKLERGEDITQTPNWWIKEEGRIYKNPIAHQVKSLDELPFPDRGIFDKYPSYTENKSFSFMTAFGCPYNCTYCFNHQVHKMLVKGDRIIRRRSVDNVIEEIKQVRKQYPLQYILFRDEIFTVNKKWVKEFSIKYSREIALPFYCVLRANHVTEEIVDDLKKAGVYNVTFAIEAGNDFIRNTVLKRNMSREAILKASKILNDKKVPFFTYNMIGTPGETFDMALETWELNIKCRPSGTWSYLVYPYPRTELHNYAVSNGYLDEGKTNEFLMTYHDKSILNLKDKRKIENFHKLFSIAVEFPFLIHIIIFLVKLPLHNFYNLIRKLWRGYTSYTKVYPRTVRQSFVELISGAFDVVFKSKA
jgi:radical SAM superfamily enzyme YgiQ (UPF0313 family)